MRTTRDHHRAGHHSSGPGSAKGSPFVGMREIYERAVHTAGAQSRSVVLGSGTRVHVIETGDGPAVLHLHGTGTSGLSHLSLLERSPDLRSFAVDRPGAGLSAPLALPTRGYREAVVAVVDDLMDALHLPSATLVGASGGGAWAIWYALARPARVRRLVLLGATPLLAGTRAPPPLRVMTTPVVGELLGRLVRPSHTAVMRLMRSMGEGETVIRHEDLLDSLVAGRSDPALARATLDEFRTFVTPFGRSGMRRSLRFRPEELRRLRMPVLLVWGTHDPLGGERVARSVARTIPDVRLELLPAGHVPWLGQPEEVARMLSAFARQGALPGFPGPR